MEFYTFPKGISPKMNVKAQLDFEPIYIEVSAQHFSFWLYK